MTPLGWYVARLRSMGLAEILHRVEEKRKKLAARRWPAGWQRFVAAKTSSPPVIPGLREALSAASEPFARHVARAAATIRKGRYSALGQSWPARSPSELFPSTLWHLDPVTGQLWPGQDRYTFDIAYRHETTLGDVKYVWEINRLQFLQALATDVLLNDDTASLAALEEAIASWHDANPPFTGIAWSSGIELALRAISLLVATSLCGERMSETCLRQVHEILAAHAVWLARYPSRFSSANNHLVAEAAGRYLLAAGYDRHGTREARAVRETLIAEAGKQILPDGCGAEQSPTYAAFTVELLLLCAFAADRTGEPFPSSVNERLNAFVESTVWFLDADGAHPRIGDDDEGRVLTLGETETYYVASVSASVASFLGVSGPHSPALGLRDAVFGRPVPLAKSPAGVHNMSHGGYTVARGRTGGREYKVILDHGPLGYLAIAAHGHADALSVLLSLDGEPVLVDPGTYLYHSGGVWRDWFRGTAAHNTLAVGDADQSAIAGPFNWSSKARARLDDCEGQDPWRMTASHDGYVRRFRVRHERDMRLEADGITLTDRLIGGSQHLTATLSFQLAPALEARVAGTTVHVSRDGDPLLEMSLPQGHIKLRRGGPEVDGGWVSLAFGHREPAGRIVWRGTLDEIGESIKLRWNL